MADTLEALANPDCGWQYRKSSDEYALIPGSPIAYWANERVTHVFKSSLPAKRYALFKHGMSTGKNEAVLRLWPEVEFGKIKLDAVSHDDLYSSKKRFVPYNKGGEFRRWWGNQCYVIGYDREYDQLMDSFSGHRHDNKSTYFMPSISWSKVSSGALAMRLFPQGFVYDVAGCSAFASPEHLPFLLALFNTSFSLTCMEFMSPTLNFEVGTLENFPVLEGLFSNRRIKDLTDRCIAIAKQDWDSFEESWGFEKHPLL